MGRDGSGAGSADRLTLARSTSSAEDPQRVRRDIALGALVLGAAVVVVGGLAITQAGPFSKSIADRVTDTVGATASCDRIGLMNLAGDQEKVYRCTYEVSAGTVSPCYSVVDGDVYDVTDRAGDEFDCSKSPVAPPPPTLPADSGTPLNGAGPVGDDRWKDPKGNVCPDKKARFGDGYPGSGLDASQLWCPASVP
jgi:hypothetical protein